MSSWQKSMIAYYDMSTVGTVPNLAPRTYGSKDGTTSNLADTDIQNGIGGGRGLYFDGADSIITVPNDSDFQGMFDGGGSIVAWIRPDSDGENNEGVIVAMWPEILFRVEGEVAGKMKIRFYHGFSTDPGNWVTTATELYTGTRTFIAITYDSSDVSNDPVLYIGEEGHIGLTETSTPAGTPEVSTDDFYIGNSSTESRTFDGLIDTLIVSDELLTSIQVHDIRIQSRRGIL